MFHVVCAEYLIDHMLFKIEPNVMHNHKHSLSQELVDK